MSTSTILITGANGQLGKEFSVLADAYPSYKFVFSDKEDLPIDSREAIKKAFQQHQPAYCINCAAYTAVDKAETDWETAFKINGNAVGLLADMCNLYSTKLVHISTDYVFDGNSQIPYKEDDSTAPVNTYGASKLRGEQLCMKNNPSSIIIRTAWVYSPFGQNFVKTMLRLMSERKEINVVSDQVGAPTYAADLAKCIMQMLPGWKKGIYHYSNAGKVSWYNFAVAIRDLTNKDCIVNPIPSTEYPTPARRPSFSLLDTTKIKNTFGCTIPGWKDSLIDCLQRLAATV